MPALARRPSPKEAFKRPCGARGCRAHVWSHRDLFCRRCFALLPAPLQVALYKHYPETRGRETYRVPTQFVALLVKAIDILEHSERGPRR